MGNFAVSFAGESGVDAGGLRKEMFTIFFRTVFSEDIPGEVYVFMCGCICV